MKKFKILIPIYNDWESVFKLLEAIDSKISIFDHEFSVILVDDASTQKIVKKKFDYKNLKSVNILKMKKNQGHTRCNATGIKYLTKHDFDYLIVMDGDGEDRPEELGLLVKNVLGKNNSTVAKRVKRSEGFIFTFFYKIHKFITFIFTGKNMNFGHYCCLKKEDVILLSSKSTLWCNFSSSVKKFIKNLDNIPCVRGLRYVQPSKMSFINLVLYSFSIIAVFKYQVLIRSILFFLILFVFLEKFSFIVIFLQSLLIIFTIIIFIVSKRGNALALANATNEIEEVLNIHTK